MHPSENFHVYADWMLTLPNAPFAYANTHSWSVHRRFPPSTIDPAPFPCCSMHMLSIVHKTRLPLGRVNICRLDCTHVCR